MASDYPPGSGASSEGNNFSVFIDCSSNGELEKLFTALSQDGKVTMPPSDMPSGRFGMCDDSFGISWIPQLCAGRLNTDGAPSQDATISVDEPLKRACDRILLGGLGCSSRR